MVVHPSPLQGKTQAAYKLKKQLQSRYHQYWKYLHARIVDHGYGPFRVSHATPQVASATP